VKICPQKKTLVVTRVFFFKSVDLEDWQVSPYFGFFFEFIGKKISIYFPNFYVAIVQKFAQNKNSGSD
jgi:hypothetical protein